MSRGTFQPLNRIHWFCHSVTVKNVSNSTSPHWIDRKHLSVLGQSMYNGVETESTEEACRGNKEADTLVVDTKVTEVTYEVLQGSGQIVKYPCNQGIMPNLFSRVWGFFSFHPLAPSMWGSCKTEPSQVGKLHIVQQLASLLVYRWHRYSSKRISPNSAWPKRFARSRGPRRGDTLGQELGWSSAEDFRAQTYMGFVTLKSAVVGRNILPQKCPLSANHNN